jgi:hypothetical protein
MQPAQWWSPNDGVGRAQWAENVLDEAIHRLGQGGLLIEEAEAVDLLESSGALRAREGSQVWFRSPFLRKTLTRLPAAFNLFDRDRQKVATLAGGEGMGGALHASVAAGPPSASVAPEDLISSIEQEASQFAFDIQGAWPPARGLPPVLADLQRLALGFQATARPQLLRPREPEALDGLGELLVALCGSRQGVEERPPVILEAIGDWGFLGRTASHTLINGARQGLPTAMVAAPPADSSVPAEDWLSETVATGIAGATIHQLARQGAPLLWGLPFVQGCSRSPSWSQVWRAGLDVGHRLGLPVLVTLWPSAAPLDALPALWAADAEACGASVMAWGGCPLGPEERRIDRLKQDGAMLEEVRRLGLLAGAGNLSPDPATQVAVALGDSRQKALATCLEALSERLGAGSQPAHQAGSDVPPGAES